MAVNQGIRWVPPLPTGWEAKYDPIQKRYFFIDHATKKTTWDDPRFSRAAAPAPAQAQQPHQPQQQHYGYGQQQQQQQHYAYYQQQQQQQQAEAIPMKTLAHQYVTAQGGQFGAGQQQQAGRSWQPNTSPAAAARQPSPRRQPQAQVQQQVQPQAVPAQEDESSFVEDVPELEADEMLVKELQALFPTCPQSKIRRCLERNCNALRATKFELEVWGYEQVKSPRRNLSPTSQSPQRGNSSENDNNQTVQKLKREFYRAEVGFIRDILAEVNNDEQRARQQLTSMGYGSSSAATGSDATSPGRRTSRGSTGAAQSSNQGRAAASPTKQAITPAKKDALVSRLAQDHPNLDRTIVELALETADYNPQKARDVLRFMYIEENTSSSPRTTSPVRQTPKATSPTRQVTRASSPIPDVSGSVTTSDAGYDEISQDYYLYDNNYARPGSVSSAGREGSASHGWPKDINQRQKTTGEAHRTPKHTGDYLYQTANYNILGLLDTCCPRPLTSSYTSVHSHSPDDSVSRINVTRSPPKPVVTSQSQVFSSKNRSQAKGANPELHDGPDISHVMRYGVLAKGPDKGLHQGPDPSRVKGSQGAMGRDPSLCRGPQKDLCHGPQPEFCRGPATIITPSRTLISQV